IPVSLTCCRGGRAAARARDFGADARGRHDHGPSSSRVAVARRAISSRVDSDGRGTPHPEKFSGRAFRVAAMFTQLIEKLIRHEDLTTDEASAAMAEVMEGRATSADIAGLLVGLAMKGERPGEIVGLARTMRAHAVQISRRYQRVFDTCGTGGDRSGTFNISSCAAGVDRKSTRLNSSH